MQDGAYSGIGLISPLNKDKNITYYIETYDYASNKKISDINRLPFIPQNREDYADSFIVDSNSSTIYTDIIQIDGNNLIGSAIFSISGTEITKFQSYNKLFGAIPPITVLSIDKEFNNLANEGFQKSAVIDEQEYRGGNTNIDFSSNVTTPSLKILGYPSKYPFDHYFFNFIIFLPIKNATLDYLNDDFYRDKITFDDQVRNNWKGVSNISNINNDSKIEHLRGLCGAPCYNHKDYSISNVMIDFSRQSHTIAILIIPLIAIFFLLGAIFIFENSLDSISNRLTLTLGIFALIFTLPEIINSMKPQIPSPTIADSMLSIIIIATIAFTISSIISSSSTIQKWFPKHHTLIDGIAFVIVSGFVIAYFNNYLFDNEIWWLVPLIIFGLGYGLLLKALGIKINKPLIHFFKVTKKKDV